MSFKYIQCHQLRISKLYLIGLLVRFKTNQIIFHVVVIRLNLLFDNTTNEVLIQTRIRKNMSLNLS